MTHRLRVALLGSAALPIAVYAVSRVSVVTGPRAPREARRPPDVVRLRDVDNCTDRPPGSKALCYRAVLARRIAAVGVESALATLGALATTDADIARDAHVYAHGIGIDAFQLRPDVGATFSQCSALFSSGCYHGVMQAYFERRRAADAATVNAACRSYEQAGATRWLLFQCLHGMGHGLDMILDHDLVRALHACDLLVDGWHRESCYGGVFMENIMHVIEPHHPATLLAEQGRAGMRHEMPALRGIDRDDPLYPCSLTAARYGRACYLIQTAAILYLNGGDIGSAARTCDHARRRFRSTCFESLGRDISAYARGSARKAIELCNLGARPFRRWCYVGVAKSFVDESARPGPGFAVCGAVPVSLDKASCYRGVGEQVAALVAEPSARAQLCTLADAAYVDVCRDGARVARLGPHAAGH